MKAKQKPSPYERVDRRSREGCGAMDGLTRYRPAYAAGAAPSLPQGKGRCYVFAIAARFSTRI